MRDKIERINMTQLVMTATAIAQTAKTARELNRQLSEMLESAGIDTDSIDFVSAYGYLEGDRDEKPLIEYVREQMQCKG